MATIPRTIVDLGLHHAQTRADDPYLLWLHNGTTEAGSYSFGEIDRKARSLAVQIRSAALASRKQTRAALPPAAIIVTRPGLEFALAFLACMYAGVAAVPAYPPKRSDTARTLRWLIDDCGASLALADGSSAKAMESEAVRAQISLLRVDHVDEALADRWVYPDIDPHSVAFIQYTSGSTGNPKGVVVTHGNLISNQQQITHAMDHDPRTVVVGWLPPFHDMGLVGNLLNPFFLGARCVLMSPAAFVVNPIRWLEAITRYRATTSGGPNFAYELCLARTTDEQRRGLDLSSWAVAFNGAEPVRASTIERFSSAFAKYGFRRSSFFPCYGMAESTLFVTGCHAYRDPTIVTVDQSQLMGGSVRLAASDDTAGGTVRIVGCGRASSTCTVAIVDPAARAELPERAVGEIWVHSPSVAQCYLGQPELSDLAFRATLSNRSSDATFLRTGDLGFLHDGELFVTGRMKDLIIVNGRNHYPQDIELSALSAHPALEGCPAAAFSVDFDDEERVVIVVSINESVMQNATTESLLRAMTRAVTHAHAVAIGDIVLTGARLPTTTSGKIRRSRCREIYLRRELEAVYAAAAAERAGFGEVVA